MKSVGDYLKAARAAKQMSLISVSRTTKIKEKFLLALENSDWDSLPGFTTTQGFTRSFAVVVGADPSVAAALLRRDFPGLEAPTRSSEMSLNPVSRWTPRTTLVAVVLVTLLLLGWYLTKQYLIFAAAPPLELKELSVNDSSNTVLVSGKTAPGASLEVNGRAVLVEETGAFSLEIPRSSVGNTLELRARSRTGKETVIRKQL